MRLKIMTRWKSHYIIFFSYKRIRGEWFNLNEEEILNFEKTVRGFEKAIIDYNYGKDNILI